MRAALAIFEAAAAGYAHIWTDERRTRWHAAAIAPSLGAATLAAANNSSLRHQRVLDGARRRVPPRDGALRLVS